MKSISLHIPWCVIVSLIGFALTSCEDYSVPAREPDDLAGKVTLVLNAEVLGSTRAAELSDKEKMSSLRVVILHPDGIVEHNAHVDFGSALTEYSTQLFEVTPDERKTIYLISNEEGVDGLKTALDGFSAGDSGFKTMIDGFVFVPDYDGYPIPLSSAYEVEVGDSFSEFRLYLVHAATKFSFTFHNRRRGAVRVNGVSVSDVADRMFLMPRKRDLNMSFLESDGSTSDLYWIEWLRRVAEESEASPADKTLADKRGWIKDYDIPSTAVTRRFASSPEEGIEIPARTYVNGTLVPGEADFPVFYLPECKNTQAGNFTDDQEYTMSFSLTDEYGLEKTFEGIAFDNLKALFRNTHVIVDVTLGESEIDVSLRYTVCPLKTFESNIPDFS